jgi:hypothetical protein
MEMDPWKACRGLLASLQYEFSKEINFASKGDLILLVTWLEDRKIRELDIEWRKPLRSDGPEWDKAFNNYLEKIGCPYKWENLAEDDSKDAIAWLISYAVSAEYEDIADTCNDMESKTYLSANEENKGGSARMDESEAENEYDSVLAPEVDKLGSMMLLKRGQGEGDHDYLQRVSRQIKLILTPGSLHALQTLGKDGIPLESFPSVFETTDEVLKQVSVVLRMLYLYDFRELQNDLNALIVLGQEYTANPKTNNALGVVGR